MRISAKDLQKLLERVRDATRPNFHLACADLFAYLDEGVPDNPVLVQFNADRQGKWNAFPGQRPARWKMPAAQFDRESLAYDLFRTVAERQDDGRGLLHHMYHRNFVENVDSFRADFLQHLVDALTRVGRAEPAEADSVHDEQQTKSPQVFVSHSSRDAYTARELVELLRASLNLGATEIRCTSVDGYRLPAGADTNAQLRQEINDATILLGIISAQSLRSLYVVFELGARWGSRKTFFPLLAPGTPSSMLAGPLSGINSLRLDSEAQVHQLLSDVACKLGRTKEPPASYAMRLKEFSAAMETQQAESIASTLEGPTESNPSHEEVDDAASIVEKEGQITAQLRLASHYFSTDPERDICVLEDCLVLVCAVRITSMLELLPILEQVARAKRSLFVVARAVRGEALATLIKNNQLGIVPVCVVSTYFSSDPARIERLIALRTGATVFDDEASIPLRLAVLSQLGGAARVEVADSTAEIALSKQDNSADASG